MVIFSHYAGWMYGEPNFPVLKEFISGWGVYGVDIFFLLSGYGLTKSASKNGITGQFVLNRVLACYVPYLLIIGFFTWINNGFEDWKDIRNYLTGKNYWYIYVQMVFYILFAICYKFNYLKEITLSIAVIAFTWWLWSIGRADFWELSNGAFLIGIYLATFEEKVTLTQKMKKQLALGLFFIAGACMLFFQAKYKESFLFSWEMARSMAFTCLIAGLCMWIDYKSLVLASLGRYSLYIYLLHGFLFWKFIYRYEELGYVKAVAVVCIISVCISVAAGLSFEQITKWMKEQLGKKLGNRQKE